MNVLSVCEGILERGDICHFCRKAQFYLRIIDREQRIAICGDKGLTDFAAFL